MAYMHKSNPSSRVVYIDREGDEIHESIWKRLRADPSYRIIGQYINDNWEVQALWKGQCQAGDRIKKPYSLLVFMRSGGARVMIGDRNENNADFADLKEMQDHYEDFLVRHCNCEWIQTNNASHFLERGNHIEKPKKTVGEFNLSEDKFSIAGATESQAENMGDW